jgi:hypothetical protein
MEDNKNCYFNFKWLKDAQAIGYTLRFDTAEMIYNSNETSSEIIYSDEIHTTGLSEYEDKDSSELEALINHYYMRSER